MKRIETLESFEQIKLLADPRRLAILRRLMAAPSSLTQLGGIFGESPAWVRHHLKKLEQAGLVEISQVTVTAGITEKFYRACAGALLLRKLVLPYSDQPPLVFAGSHDTALDQVSGQLSPHIHLVTLPVGSLDGLINLRQGLCHVAGTHLLDESGEYNTPYVNLLFPDRQVELVTLAHRTQGLIVPEGNPKGLREIKDLAREEVTFINRNPGSGTRVWLDRELAYLGLGPNQITGYDRVVNTHSGAAYLVWAGKADVALGIQAAAAQHQLGFVPLFDERYDLIFLRAQLEPVLPLLDYLQTKQFRTCLQSLTGYNTAHSGERIAS
ncbi:MAG: helix-turn-helix domain-containing protein [Anaerolineales bacterium]|nr:helix-turn-helix domain-containing protein [Anaerolineales bacterium]